MTSKRRLAPGLNCWFLARQLDQRDRAGGAGGAAQADSAKHSCHENTAVTRPLSCASASASAQRSAAFVSAKGPDKRIVRNVESELTERTAPQP
jgi:hypothetical protein